MIKCNRCGNVAPAGLTNCKNCGEPLSGSPDVGAGSKKATPGKSELPAWLESLRVDERRFDERPAPPISDQPSFSTADLIDDGSLPGWMRPGGADVSGNTGQQPAWTPPATPSPDMDQGFSAGSLIDEQALPSWMHENQAASPPAAQERNISASSLLQPDAAPEWMKNIQQQSSAQQRQPQQPQNIPPSPAAPSFNTPSARGFSAKDLIDEQSLPSWMAGQAQGGQKPQNMPSSPSASQPNTPSARGFSAKDLIDEQSLPSWMAGQAKGGQKPPNEPSSPATPPVNTPSARGFSAKDLIDEQALPSWMAGQAGQAKSEQKPPNEPQSGLSAASLLDPNSLPAWMRESEQKQGQGAAPPQQAGGFGQGNQQPPQGAGYQNGLSAPSLIDMNALPEWLRNGGGLSQPGAPSQPQGAQPRPGFNAPVPPGVENVRVPSRPRSEPGAQEQSEVAANVFASMLGVASTNQSIPGQPQSGPNTMGGQQSFSGIPGMGSFQQGQQGMPPASPNPNSMSGMQGQPQWMQNMQPGGGNQQRPNQNQPDPYRAQANPQGQQQAWMQQMGSAPGSQPGYPNSGYAGNQAGFSSQPPASQPGMPDSGQGRNAGKTAKRGFLETILGWFPFSR